ncbi:MAG: GntR family transcriptional regulator [Anaerolineales bacterium]|nr:GntR family transcriptional regulator [Anaerolineales bacterium]
MQLRLDFHEKEPIYLQIVEQVKSMVASGVLAPGSQLPTVREVAAELCINFNTAARAYRLLHEEGIISTQQGRGTYVLEPPSPSEGRRMKRERLQAMVHGWLEEAKRLGFSPDEVEKAWQEGFHRWRRS